MASHRDFLQRIETTASELKQKANSGNRNLHTEIRALSAKLEPDSIMISRLENMSMVIRGVKKIREKTMKALEEMEEAKEELESIEGQIDAIVMQTYVSIGLSGTIPDNFFGDLSGLFERWRSVEKKRETCEKTLQEISEKLDDALKAFDEYSWLTSETDAKGPASSGFDRSHFERFDIEHLNTLRHMLLSMANLFIVRLTYPEEPKWRSFVIKSVVQDMTNTPRIVSLLQSEIGKIKSLKKSLQRKRMITSRRGLTNDTALFWEVLKLHQAVTAAMPKDLIEAERDFRMKVHDLSRNVSRETTKVGKLTTTYVFGDSEQDSEHTKATSEFIRFADSEMRREFKHKIFLLENAFFGLGYKGFDIFSGDVEEFLQEENAVLYLSLISSHLRESSYTRAEVDELLDMFGLPEELAQLISPLNFALHHRRVREFECPPDFPVSNFCPACVSGNRSTGCIAKFVDATPFEVLFLHDLKLMNPFIEVGSRGSVLNISVIRDRPDGSG